MYELMKKAKNLSREQKVSFLNDIEELIILAEAPRKEVLRNMELKAIDDVNSDGFVDEKAENVPNRRRQNRGMDTKKNPDGKVRPRYIPKNYDHLNQDRKSDSFGHESFAYSDEKIVVSKRLHDPETSEEMESLIRLLEKNLSIDGDLSYENLSVFLIPLLRGSQRVGLKKNKIVGFMKKLCRLSRKYQRVKSQKSSYKEKHDIRKEFYECIREIKEKLDIKNEIKKVANKAEEIYEMDPREVLRSNLINLKLTGMDIDGAREQVKRISQSLDYDALSIIDDVLSEVFS